jgi:hypothetical protein
MCNAQIKFMRWENQRQAPLRTFARKAIERVSKPCLGKAASAVERGSSNSVPNTARVCQGCSLQLSAIDRVLPVRNAAVRSCSRMSADFRKTSVRTRPLAPAGPGWYIAGTKSPSVPPCEHEDSMLNDTRICPARPNAAINPPSSTRFIRSCARTAVSCGASPIDG